MTMQQRGMEQETVDREEKKKTRLLMSQSLKEVLPANLHSLADADPESAMKLYEQLQTNSARGSSNEETFFGSPVPFKREDGSIGLGQLGNKGNFREVDLPGELAPTTKQVDTGTEIITQDIYGNEMYRTPKQNRKAAYETGYGGLEGKTDAENDALAESVTRKMPGLRSVIDTLSSLADTATYTQSGQAMDSVKREFGLPVGQGAIDRASYIAIVDNQVLPLLKDTFGAAFTVQEGASLRATLGDPDKSPPEKKAILDAFIAQKERDVASMNKGPSQGSPASSGGVDDILSGYGL